MTDDELRLNIDSLHASVHELFEAVQRHDVHLEHLITTSRQDWPEHSAPGTNRSRRSRFHQTVGTCRHGSRATARQARL